MRTAARRSGRAAAVAAAILLLSGPAARAGGAPEVPAAPALRVAVLPFAQRGAPSGSWALVQAPLAAALSERGLEPVEMGRVEAELRARRLRELSLMTRAEIAALAEALGADRLLLGVVYRLDEGERPSVSLSARLLDPGRSAVEAMAFASVEGRSLLGPLGTGGPATVERTVADAVRRLAASLAAQRQAGRDGGVPKNSVLAPAPAAYVSSGLLRRAVRTIVVLPFRNLSRQPGAGQSAADLGSWCLRSLTPIVLLDPGDATRRLLAGGWRTGMPVGRPEVRSLGEASGVDAVLMGGVERWEEGDGAGARPPEITLSLRLLDAETGDILWMAQHERRGDETRTFYEAGNIRHSEVLMARASCEALASLSETLNRNAPSATGGSSP